MCSKVFANILLVPKIVSEITPSNELMFFSVDSNEVETQVSVENFLKTDMKEKVLKSVILGTLDDSYVYNTYKVIFY